MKQKSGVFPVIFMISFIGLCMGFSFMFRNQEKKYSEILISVKPGTNIEAVKKIADKYNFDLQKRDFAFNTMNEFTAKHQIYKIYKYSIHPEKFNKILAELEKLKASQVIGEIEPNYQVKAMVNDPLFNKQWNLKELEIEKVWTKGTGKGVTVAVIDTGVSKTLGDLSASRFVSGYNFVEKNDNWDDGQGHGSHVAGTIGQDTDNGKGVAGIAYECSIMPLRVLNEQGFGSTLDIAEAIVYAADKGANIINMSLGGGEFSNVLKDACDYAYNKGVTIIAAAGNESRNKASYPGCYDTVISVAASNPAGELAYYSNFGEGVDVAAPGGETSKKLQNGVLQNAPDFLAKNIKEYEKENNDYFFYFQGTSMASPHVAGTAAILYQLGVTKPADIRNLLIDSSQKKIRDIPFINPLKAVEKIKEPIKDNPEAPVKPGKVFFNSGVIAVSPLTSVLTIGLGLILFFIFNKTRKKINAIDNTVVPLTFIGLILGANGLSLAGFYLQSLFPFTLLPERFVGLLFNSVLDYDRVLLFLSQPTPVWHNFLIPLAAMVLLNFKDQTKRCFSIGLLIGFAAKLIGDGLFINELMFIPDGLPDMLFLVINGIITFAFPYIMVKNE